jgi:hypothetical protein
VKHLEVENGRHVHGELAGEARGDAVGALAVAGDQIDTGGGVEDDQGSGPRSPRISSAAESPISLGSRREMRSASSAKVGFSAIPSSSASR